MIDVKNIAVYNKDGLAVLRNIPDETIDLIVADPPYGLNKDYGNDSDCMGNEEYLQWMESWVKLARVKLKKRGLLYIFQSWQRAPEVFSICKKSFIMINEIIWDRRVPSMGGTTRRFSSVHDNIGVFAIDKNYYFNIDPVRIPYDEATKKARSRSIFVGAKWLEIGYNPKDVWSISRLHAIHSERMDHPTQKPRELIDRIILSSSPEEGLVVDPFGGTGTTAESCLANNRSCVTAEINVNYYNQILERINSYEGDNCVPVTNKPATSQPHSLRKSGVSESAIIKCLSGKPVSSLEIADKLQVQRTDVAKTLLNLKVSGKIKSIGKARGTKYYIGDISEIESMTDNPRQENLFMA